MFRDEIDIAEKAVRYMLDQVDGVIVADNLSMDGTDRVLKKMAKEFSDRFWVIDDTEPGYYQSQKMTKLAHYAYNAFKAEWIVPFDADEMWFPPRDYNGKLKDFLMESKHDAIGSDIYNYSPTEKDDPGCPLDTMVWRNDGQAGACVAFRYHETAIVGQGNHDVLVNNQRVPAPVAIQIRHYPYRSADQFVTKMVHGAQAYNATNLPYSLGSHWRDYGKQSDEQLAKFFNNNVLVKDPENEPTLMYDPLSEWIK